MACLSIRMDQTAEAVVSYENEHISAEFDTIADVAATTKGAGIAACHWPRGLGFAGELAGATGHFAKKTFHQNLWLPDECL